MITIGSLFSGIGGLESGLGAALDDAGIGHRVAWQCEIDPFCRMVLEKHWPNVERFNDVETAKPTPVDLVCLGFPCQDISDAGSRAGITGERSGLWFAAARIIGAIRPRFVVVENVAALRNRGLDVVLGDLAALGYDATWDCIPAAAVGAPHRRDRLYLVAWRVSDADGFRLRIEPERGTGRAQAADGGDAEPIELGAIWGRALADGDGRRLEGERVEDREPGYRGPRGDEPYGRRGEETEMVADADGEPIPRGSERAGRQAGSESQGASGEAAKLGNADGPRFEGPRVQRYQPRQSSHRWPPGPDDVQAWRAMPARAQPAFCRITHGIPRRLDRLRALGNSVVPIVAKAVGRVVVQLIEGSAP